MSEEERAAFLRYLDDYNTRKSAWIHDARQPEPEPVHWPHPDWWPEPDGEGEETV